jgi:hypothetical protein
VMAIFRLFSVVFCHFLSRRNINEWSLKFAIFSKNIYKNIFSHATSVTMWSLVVAATPKQSELLLGQCWDHFLW